ncbi:hypothetical protein D8Y22_09810 [Salinadaptatus halalkaliphilus]|uniref:Right-handed parallel beta-helix repeat-containing protein n=1 Tax=Salinadaptatus halalkaliphilus TaxID=2419781 RepID=A0A4S3TQS6_9EURY|nr:right-handed parallel beta-helix repeat-containing protein [Salinadaptatus halalkaliphilus]THE64908.1 hypothetical protein D8Y22_09810 [Salinadaptatus halalkaliphilus]
MTDTHDSQTDGEDRSLLGRRSYLRGAASAATLSVVGVGAVAADESFDVVEVSAGDTYRVQLGSGDTLENTLIDITARGAQYQINATGTDWEIRNVGVRGSWDSHAKAEPLIVSVSAGGSARIENLYLGDGSPDDTYPGATGIFVAGSHAGVLEIDRVNIQGYPDNAIYGSSPGNPARHPAGRGGGGEVHITNSYAADCRAGGFRVGTNGSYVENCVATGCDRNAWGFYEEIEVIDCDFSGARMGDIGTGDSHWRENARVRVTDSRFESTVEHSGRVIGESVGSPQRTEPEDVEGVPLTAEQAASGSAEPPSSGGPGNGDDEDDEDDEEDDGDGDEYLLAFVTEPEANLASYEFLAEGPVEFADAPYETPSGGSIEGGTFEAEDFIDEHGDTRHAGGTTGGGHGDAFRVAGPITDIALEQPDVMWVELDGERMELEEIIEETADDGNEDEEGNENAGDDRLLAFVTEPEARFASYEFTAGGPVEFADAPYETPSGGSIEGGTYQSEDFVDEDGDSWHAGGTTGGGNGDAFRIEGPVTAIDLEQPDVMWIELDGDRMDPEAVIEETADDGDEDDDNGDENDGNEDDGEPGDEDDGEDDAELTNALVVDGSYSSEPSTYTFEVTGSVEVSTYRDATLEETDVDGTAVSGAVAGDRDAYWFSGDIVDFSVSGDARIDIEYDAR